MAEGGRRETDYDDPTNYLVEVASNKLNLRMMRQRNHPDHIPKSRNGLNSGIAT